MSYNKQYSKNWYQQNKERIIQKWKDKRANNLEEFKQRQKIYRENNKEYQQNYNKQYYQDNKEKMNQQSRQYYIDNKEDYLNKKKQYFQKKKRENRKQMIQIIDEWSNEYKHKSFDKFEIFENGEIWNTKDFKLIAKSLGDDGYYSVCLNHKRYRLSRLIASTFDDRDEVELQELHCHHCDISPLNNNLSNLVFLPENLHQLLHKNLTNEQILLIGEQVKHLRGSAKTNLFVELVLGAFAKITLA